MAIVQAAIIGSTAGEDKFPRPGTGDFIAQYPDIDVQGSPFGPGSSQTSVNNGISGFYRRAVLGSWATGNYATTDMTFFNGKAVVSQTRDTYVSFGDQVDKQENYSMYWLGYFQAPVSGNYNVKIDSDNNSMCWIGEYAISGFNGNNYIVSQGGSTTNSLTLVAGKWYPVRIWYQETGGNNRFQMFIGLVGQAMLSMDYWAGDNRIRYDSVTKGLNAPLYYFQTPNTIFSINEGSSQTVDITTWGVKDGTILYWTVENVTTINADFDSVSGSFTVVANTGSFTVTPSADHVTEGSQTFNVQIRTGSISGPVVSTSATGTIGDTSLNPTYTLATAGNVTSIDEGSELTFNVTTDAIDGTTLYWFVGSTGSYALSAGRFSPGTGGSFTVNSGAGTFTVTISADSFTATGTQSYNIFLSTTSPSPTSVGNTLSITVNDTSQSPTYEVTAVGDVASVNEGSVLTFDVTTTNVPNGTTLYWTIGHVNTNSADFSATSGTVTINSNTGSFTVTALADTTTEGAETFVVRIRTVSTSGTIVATSSTKTINDTSLSPPVNGSAVFNQPQTDYVSLPALPDWNLGTTWTVEFWLYMNSSSIGGNQQGGIWALLNQKGWATTDSINIALSGGYLQINQGNNTSYYNKYIIEPAPLQWVHVAIVNNAGTNKVYYNGIEQVPPGGIGSQDYTASWTNSTNPLYIGSLGDYAGGSGPGGSTFDGKITNLRITDRAEYLTNFNPPTVLPTKITNHTRLLWTPTDQALATDTSDDPHTITNNGVTYSSSYPATNNTRGSAVFNGSTNRFYKIPGGSHLQLGTTWTIEWWQKSTAVTAGNGNLYTIMSQAPDGGRIDIYYQGGNLVVQNGQTLCAEPAIDVWVHVAIVNNAGVGTVYYDGVAQGATGNFGNYGQTQDLYIGKRGNNTFQYFNGKLTNIRITDTAVYTSNFVPDQLPTVVASHTKLLLRPTVDTIYGVDDGNLGLAVSSSGATYSSDYAPVTNTYTALDYNENDGYAGGYSTNSIRVNIPDYPGILNVPNGATVVVSGQASGTFTVGSGLVSSQAITTGNIRILVMGLGIAIYGGDTLTFTWRT